MHEDDGGTARVEALIREAGRNQVSDEEPFDNEKWTRFLSAAAALRDLGNAGLEAVVAHFRRGDGRGRVMAADLVGRMAFEATPDLREGCLAALGQMLVQEQAEQNDPSVVAAICYGFGHLQDGRALASVLELGRHPHPGVRFAAACAVPAVCNWEAQPDAISVLVQLSGDSSADVRNWACFGLGQLGADSAAVREALAARLDDADDETRCEALVALARTGDSRVYPALARRLESPTCGSSRSRPRQSSPMSACTRNSWRCRKTGRTTTISSRPR